MTAALSGRPTAAVTALVPRPRPSADNARYDISAGQAPAPAVDGGTRQRDAQARWVLSALLGGDGEQPSWQERGLCAQTDPEAFFPDKGGSTREAKRICSGCEVRAECLTFALANDERFGIWGGLSERERRRLRRAQP